MQQPEPQNTENTLVFRIPGSLSATLKILFTVAFPMRVRSCLMNVCGTSRTHLYTHTHAKMHTYTRIHISCRSSGDRFGSNA